MEFKDALKRLRTRQGLSQAELAKKLGFSPALIGLYEVGKRKPSFEALEVVADFFNVSTDYLLGKDDKSVYYFDVQTANIAQDISSRAELKELFELARTLKDEDIYIIYSMAKRLANK